MAALHLGLRRGRLPLLQELGEVRRILVVFDTGKRRRDLDG